MSTFIPGTPLPGEYSAFAAGYVEKAKSYADPVQKLSEQLKEVLDLLRTLPVEKQLHRYGAGKWSVKEVLGHITDAERIFSYRALRVARNDQTPLAGFDENSYVPAAKAERCDWTELVEEFEHVRRATVLLLKHIPDAAWSNTGIASGAPVSVRALAYIMIGHVSHHLEILRDRYLI